MIGDIAVDGEPGGLLLGLHYGPYSSLLPLVLARRLGRVSFLVDRRLDPSLVLPTERVHELERAGVLPPGALAAIDGGVRRVRDELARGSAVVVLVDPYFLPPGSRSVGLRIGARELRVPRGAAWLSEQTACAVAAVSIVPTATGHRVAVRGVADVSAALTVLAEQVVADPAPWEGWLREQRHL
ncbi:MAG TPA: hypothetical protein VGK79_11440 [Gaiellaceae bacterium]